MNIKENILRVGEQMVKSFSDRDTYEWPPTCLGLLYQPIRPVSNEKMSTNENDN